jgi:hypothetical protein
VPPVDAGCHWLVTLSNWLGTAILFRIGKGIFAVTLAKYQSSLGLQQKSSKIVVWVPIVSPVGSGKAFCQVNQ